MSGEFASVVSITALIMALFALIRSIKEPPSPPNVLVIVEGRGNEKGAAVVLRRAVIVTDTHGVRYQNGSRDPDGRGVGDAVTPPFPELKGHEGELLRMYLVREEL